MSLVALETAFSAKAGSGGKPSAALTLLITSAALGSLTLLGRSLILVGSTVPRLLEELPLEPIGCRVPASPVVVPREACAADHGRGLLWSIPSGGLALVLIYDTHLSEQPHKILELRRNLDHNALRRHAH